MWHRLYMSCSLILIRLCPCSCCGVAVLYCPLHYWGRCEKDDFTVVVRVCWGSAGTWPRPAHRPWQRVIASMHNAVFKASLVKYWTQQCADKGTSQQWEQWQGQSYVFWYPCYLFLGLGTCLNAWMLQYSWLKHASFNTCIVSIALC